MYSLYRAWLMRDAMTAASWTTPPDLVITVGNTGTEPRNEPRNCGYQFMAHKHLVSFHSGYLKSLIQNESQGCQMPIINISLPNISSESFAPLLSFMYTGYLDLTSENIYSVLLATHLLHMPRALDLCRAYLVQNQPEVQPNTDFQPNLYNCQYNYNIIKPIPSRKMQNCLSSIWSPINLPPLMIQTRPNGPFQCVSPTEKTLKASESASPQAIPSTSKTNESSSESLCISPSFSSESFSADERSNNFTKSTQKKNLRKKESFVKKRINNENLKVEYDVACCDGPIRFHRVLNESYGLDLEEITDDKEIDKQADLEKITEKEYLENYPKTHYLELKASNFTNFMQQQMIHSNLLKKSKTAKGVIQMRKVIEKQSAMVDNNEDCGKEENPERKFSCAYCKHIFKSQYCFQKHTKRHINSAENSEESGKNVQAASSQILNRRIDKQRDVINVKREVRLLDMNVQYYPCKTCGSKFPSYYFVHKHRKLCHANEENDDDNENNNHMLDNADVISERNVTQSLDQEKT